MDIGIMLFIGWLCASVGFFGIVKLIDRAIRRIKDAKERRQVRRVLRIF